LFKLETRAESELSPGGAKLLFFSCLKLSVEDLDIVVERLGLKLK